MTINDFFGIVKKKPNTYTNNDECRNYERKLFSAIKCKEKNHKDYLRVQLNRTLSKKDRDGAYNRTKYLWGKLVEKVNVLRDVKILSVGCHNMYEIQAFHEMGFKNVTGIDLYSENKSILVMDMHDMTFKDNTFDLIFSSHSLEHAQNYKKAISEFVRVAKDGSIFVIEVPVNFETRVADLWDFESLDKLISLFEPYIRKVLFEEFVKKDAKNNTGTDIIRIIFTIKKEDTI